MTNERGEEIEFVASVKGMSLAQWVLQNLLAATRGGFGRKDTARLSTQAFTAFTDALCLLGLRHFSIRSRFGNDGVFRVHAPVRVGCFCRWFNPDGFIDGHLLT